MLVSRRWLEQYVSLTDDHDQLVDRLTMSGLNYEGSETVDDDLKIDLEVTSNRPDCLGHIGVAREISVLFDTPLNIPVSEPRESGPAIENDFSVRIDCPDLCYRFTARLIRGVSIGPSPDWLVRRLATVGIESVNHIVDVSNYVMLECGQPLHAFDYDRLQGHQIIVREPVDGEKLLAINHANYALEPGMCVIADAGSAVGLGGVMGGAETEVSDATRNILVEAAWFDPMTIRNTARKLNLHSAASFRFERSIDSAQIDWASRRCCQLILDLAGGELAAGKIDTGRPVSARPPIGFRHRRISQVLGIDIPADRVTGILNQLGFETTGLDEPDSKASMTVVPPSWRQDVTREIDLIEEVGRIHGYQHVPDDVEVPMAASVRSHADRVVRRIRMAMSAAGVDEAMTASLVPEKWSSAFSPWSQSPPLQSSQPMLGVLDKASQNLGAVNLLRRSLVPSLLEVFRINEHKQNEDVHLFETAHVYLSRGADSLPDEPVKLGLVSSSGYEQLKGILESVVQLLAPGTAINARDCDYGILDVTRSAELTIGDRTFGWIGEVSESGREMFFLRGTCSVAEVDVATLIDLAVPMVMHADVSPYPAITRDFNFVLDENVRWGELAQTVRAAAGKFLESVDYRETFRDPGKDGANKKRVLLTVVLRSDAGTLTREQAEEASSKIVVQCRQTHAAELLA